MLRLFDDKERRDQERFEGQKEAVATALDSAKEAAGKAATSAMLLVSVVGVGFAALTALILLVR